MCKKRVWYPELELNLSLQEPGGYPWFTHNDIEAQEGSQEAFEQMLHERQRQAVRGALSSM